MAKTDTEEAPEKSEPKPKKGRSKLLLLGIPVFVLLMGGGAGAWWYFNQGADTAGAEKAAEETEATTAGLLALDSFIVNLADIGGRKYLRVTMVLQVPSEAVAKEVEENKLTMSRLRSAIIEVLTSRSSVQLTTAEGRTALKAAVAETAKHVGHLDVTDVLLEEFLIQ